MMYGDNKQVVWVGHVNLSTFFYGSIGVHRAVNVSEILHMSCLIGGPWLQALLPIVCRTKSKT